MDARGGHNVAGTSLCEGGITIDLSGLRSVRVDPEARIADVDPGATIGDLDRETQAFGLVAPSGVVSETGIAGLTLGGGIGWVRRKYGLASDNLLSVDIVTADGVFRHASDDEHPDLFWALRGGGGNFGVVTSFRFRLHPVGPTVYFAAPMYPMERAAEIVPLWRDFCEEVDDDEISSFCIFQTLPEADAFPKELWGREVIALPTVHVGPVEEGEAALAPLRGYGEPLLDMSGPSSWCDLQQAFDWIFPAGKRYYWKTNSLGPLTTDSIAAIIDVGTSRSSPGTGVAIWQSGGAMSRVADDATGFGPRGAPWGLNIDAGWTDPAEDEAHIAWTRDAWARLKEFAGEGQYVNYAALESSDQLRLAFGANFERLREIKRRYDPDNLFRVNQNIRP